MAFRSNGDLLVTNALAQTITEINPNTSVASTFATGFSEMWGLTAGPDGRFYIASGHIGNPGPQNIVQVVGANGGAAQQFNAGGSMNGPNDLVFHSNGNLFVVSVFDSQVSEFDGTTGAFIASFQPYASQGAGGITVGPVTGGPRTIAPLSALPTITHPVIIDGTTQPGYAGTPIIELSGASAGTGVTGLTITAGNSTVEGLVINRFSGDGIDLLSNGGDLVEGNYIGTDVTGSALLTNAANAVNIQSPNNTVGGSTAGSGNVIAGQTGAAGIWISGSLATGNVVEGNLVGTNASGTAILGALGDDININSGASHNLVGTNGDGVNDAAERNVLAGATFQGVAIYNAGTSFNVVAGNLIGTDITGTKALGNGFAGVAFGYTSGGGPTNNLIGPSGHDVDSAGERNIISGNSSAGVFFGFGGGQGATNNTIAGNYIGTDITGTVALGNGRGIDIESGANGEIIGGASSIDPNTGKLFGVGNVISGNLHSGIYINGTADNVVQGNFIGTDVTGKHALPNAASGDGSDGVDIMNGGSGNLIGGASSVDANGNLSGLGNLISGNNLGFSDGLTIFGTTAAPSANNLVQGNFIGTDITGTSSLGNAYSGVHVGTIGALNNTIGGTTPGTGNLISGNLNVGLRIVDSGGTTRTLVEGNLIGTNAAGTAALGNGIVGTMGVTAYSLPAPRATPSAARRPRPAMSSPETRALGWT
jgi:titin